ncbi:MAG: hydrogenase 2 operon protein HybA [Desulfobacterales bacterium]|nr:hydrogenase 2 operon protein HybA [Desulfobacteraceae bacterium]MBT7085239.1 hydrogenase 2 operon protein HybA [Desulfobacterales bacterium]MBT7696356.1 hydrogenase 2 operon protein HybA [Desulfobacterales bacterium]
MRRRDFLKVVAGTTAMAVSPSLSFASSPGKKRLPGAMGMLYDATLCIGCEVCMVACRKANNLSPQPTGIQKLWDNPKNLSFETYNIIKKYQNGTGKVKDNEINGFSFVKSQCMHCVDPSCVSACPASAMTKDKETGVVSYNPEACIGCRYCQVACPFNIPKFEWDSPFPEIAKCEMCSHLQAKGEIPACCSECPTGATIFGPVESLLIEAKRRQNMEPGKYYYFPANSLKSGKTNEKSASKYIPRIYGETEIGGTQVLMLSGVPFNKIGLPDLPDRSYTSISENIQHTLYRGMILPVIIFGGLTYLVAKNKNNNE